MGIGHGDSDAGAELDHPLEPLIIGVPDDGNGSRSDDTAGAHEFDVQQEVAPVAGLEGPELTPRLRGREPALKVSQRRVLLQGPECGVVPGVVAQLCSASRFRERSDKTGIPAGGARGVSQALQLIVSHLEKGHRLARREPLQQRDERAGNRPLEDRRQALPE